MKGVPDFFYVTTFQTVDVVMDSASSPLQMCYQMVAFPSGQSNPLVPQCQHTKPWEIIIFLDCLILSNNLACSICLKAVFETYNQLNLQICKFGTSHLFIILTGMQTYQ